MSAGDGFDQVWALANQLRGEQHINPGALISTAAQRDIALTWRDVIHIYDRFGGRGYESPPPPHLLTFIAELARRGGARSIFDPCATSFVPLWAVDDMVKSTEPSAMSCSTRNRQPPPNTLPQRSSGTSGSH